MKTSDFLLRSLLLCQPVLRSLRELLFRLLITLLPVQKKLANNLFEDVTQMDFYDNPAAVDRAANQVDRHFQATL